MNSDQLVTLTKEFIQNATNYNMPYLNAIYSDKLIIVMVDENDNVSRLDKEQLMVFFQKRIDDKLPPLSDKSNFLYAGGDENSAMVIVSREMTFNDRLEKMLFTLIWEKTATGWQVVKESSSTKPL